MTNSGTLSENVQKIIKKAITKYPDGQQRAALKTALMAVQEEQGYLTEKSMQAIADFLKIPPVSVYEVASFYTMFDCAPVGQYKISLCTNVACWLRGSDKLLECIKNKLNITSGQTTADRKFTLKEVECLAACGQAPVLQINGQYAGPVSADALECWIDSPDGSLPCS